MGFTFLSRGGPIGQIESHYRHDETGDRYRWNDETGEVWINSRAVSHGEIIAFRSWMLAEFDRAVAEMRADPARYPPHLVDALKPPHVTIPGERDWFAGLVDQASQTEAGRAFEGAGFTLRHTGGGCTAWGRDIAGTPWQVMITDSEGLCHQLLAGAKAVDGSGRPDFWIVGVHYNGTDVEADQDIEAECSEAVDVPAALAAAEQWIARVVAMLPKARAV